MSEQFRFGPAWTGGKDCCGKPAGCTNLSRTCLFRNSWWKKQIEENPRIMEWLGEFLCKIRPDISRAYDILYDAGIEPRKAADIVVTAAKLGEDPEKIARKFLRLKAALEAGNG